MAVFCCKVVMTFLAIQLRLQPLAFAQETFVASFQNDLDGSLTVSSNVWIEVLSKIPNMKEFTTCHWIKIKFYNNRIAACLWSYCIVQNGKQEMECVQVCLSGLLHSANRNMLFAGSIRLNNYDGVQELKGKFRSYSHRTWAHLCWSFSAVNGESKIYHNGEMIKHEVLNVTQDDVAMKASSDEIDGALIFGQEPDSMRGGFSKDEAFIGQLSELNIWNRTLVNEDILGLASCKQILEGNIVAWKKSALSLHNVVIEDIPSHSLFCTPYKQHVIFPQKMRLEEAKRICEIHGGIIAVPRSDKDSKMILDILYKHKRNCMETKNRGGMYAVWMGARRIGKNWYELNTTTSEGKPLKYTKRLLGISNSNSDCSYLQNDGTWIELTKESCRSPMLCTVCEIKGYPVFTVKGLCTTGYFDYNYYLSLDNKNQIKFYEGYMNANIAFDDVNHEWKISDKLGNSRNLVAKLKVDKFTSQSPIGRKTWFVQDALCKSNDPNHTVTISNCNFPSEFTCNSGHCIDIKYKCDETEQCIDGSDETFCDLIHIQPSYNRANAPRPEDKKHVFQIETKIIIVKIDSIDTVNMILTVTMEINFEWRDNRLEFSNLRSYKDNQGFHRISNEKANELWNPFRDIIHDNVIIGEVKYGKYDMDIHPNTVTNSDPSNPIETLLFNGSSNPLHLTRRMKMKYDCTFDVRRFPFDKQNCSLIMKIKQPPDRRIRFINDNDIIYNGEGIIGQYAIENINAMVNNTKKSSRLIIVIPMSRMATNQILSTFSPTFVLWLFGYSTMFIDPTENGFNNRFMGAATALLVIATLIATVKSDLPKTAYMKFVDIWFLWHVVSVFTIIVYHIILSRIRANLEMLLALEKTDQVSVFGKDEEEALRKTDLGLIKKVNKAMLIVFPTLTATFYFAYFYLKLA